MKFKIKNNSLIILVFALAGCLFFIIRDYKDRQIVERGRPSAVVADKKALLNTYWGMSVVEVETALNTSLEPITDIHSFYTPKDPVKDNGDFRAFKEDGRRLLGRSATVSYIFHRDRLFQYRVFIKDADGEALDSDVTRYLTGEFGPLFIKSEEGGIARTIWQKKDKIVNYWFYKDDLGLRERFVAGFAVLYEPIENES